MMKKMLLLLTVLCMATISQAQTWDEWFNQKKTSLRYLAEQIVAFRIYGSAVKKGFDLLQGGLKNIGRLKASDLSLHQEHFAALMKVSSSVKGHAVVQRIYFLATAVQRLYAENKKRLLKADEFAPGEKEYFKKVLTTVLTTCQVAVEEAVLLTSDRRYQLSDDERLKRLQAVAGNLEDLTVFAQHFQNEIATTALNRLKAQKELKRLKSLY